MRLLLFTVGIFVFCSPSQGFAQNSSAVKAASASRTIKVIGRSESLVSSKEVTLNDIARISSKHISDDDAIIALKQIRLLSSPKPGESASISASQVLERMREEGVQLEKIGYAFPRMMNIDRAARSISTLEVETAIKNAMPADGDSELIEIHYDESIKIAPGMVSLTVKVLPSNKTGKHLAKVTAKTPEEPPVFFSVPLTVREWVEVPVAKRPLPKGSVVSSSDMVMARADLSELPVDAARDVEQIVGHETKHAIGYGEVFRKKKLSIPPLVERGSRVTLVYKTSLLEATASGVALEDGIEGQRIRVKNESSKKTISGEVMNSGLIKVNP